MDKDDIDLLESQGWEVECERPFEISKNDPTDGCLGRATGDAAELILKSLKNERKRKRLQPRWTVEYEIVDWLTSGWAGKGYRFFDRKSDAEIVYYSLGKDKGNERKVKLRPFDEDEDWQFVADQVGK